MKSLFGRSPAWVFAAVLMLGGFGLGLGMRALDWLDGALGVALMLGSIGAARWTMRRLPASHRLQRLLDSLSGQSLARAQQQLRELEQGLQ